MPIGLTAYIKPKNDGFVGIVQASQVLGGGGHGTLPDATISVGNIGQHLLDEDDMVSNSNTQGATQQSIKAYVDGLSASHTHDGDTLQFDGINSDGGAFAFTTTGAVTFNQKIIAQVAGNSFDFQNTTDNANNQVGILRGGNRATAVALDKAHIDFTLDNSVGTQITMASIFWQANTITAGSEDGEFRMFTALNGVLKETLTFGFLSAGNGTFQINTDQEDINLYFMTPNNQFTFGIDGGFETVYIGSAVVADTSQFTIDGFQDLTQLRVQSHSTQNADPIIFEKSDGTDYFRINSAFNLTYGSGTGDVFFTMDGGANDGVIIWKDDEDYFSYSDDILMFLGQKIYFEDTNYSISKNAVSAQLEFDVLGLTEAVLSATGLTIGSAAAGVDYQLTFHGENRDCNLTWMEDERELYIDYNFTLETDVAESSFSLNFGHNPVGATMAYAGATKNLVIYGTAGVGETWGVGIDFIAGSADTALYEGGRCTFAAGNFDLGAGQWNYGGSIEQHGATTDAGGNIILWPGPADSGTHGIVIVEGDLQVTGTIDGGTPTMASHGDDVDAFIDALNGADIFVRDDADSNILQFTYPGSAVNYFKMTSAATGNNPTLEVVGSDATIPLQLIPKGATIGSVVIGNGAAGVNYRLTFQGETFQGNLDWWEDENTFAFQDHVTMVTGSELYFGSTNLSIRNSTPTTLSFKTSLGGFRFDVNGTDEVVIDTHEMIFENGATDSALGWATNGQLDAKIGGNIRWSLTDTGVSFGGGLSNNFTIAINTVLNDLLLTWDYANAVLGFSDHILLESNKEVRFADNGNYVGFKAPALSANQIWALPDADGAAGEELVTDGSGNLNWGNSSAPRASITTATDMILSAAEINPFKLGDYLLYNFTANVTESDITYDSTNGDFEVDKAGEYRISCNFYVIGNATTTFSVIVKKNGVAFYTHTASVHSSVDPVERTVNLVKTLAATDKISFHVDSLTANTIQCVDGTTATITRTAGSAQASGITPIDASVMWYIKDDFHTQVWGKAIDSELYWYGAVSGSGATSAVQAAEANHPGVGKLSTGTTLSGRVTYYQYVKSVYSTIGDTFRTWLKPAVTGLGRKLRIGFGDNLTNGTHTDGIWFEYDAGASGNWIVKNANAGATTSTTTGTAVTTSWVELKAVYVDAVIGIRFYVDGALVATHTTNLPAGKEYGPVLQWHNVSSASNRDLYWDFFEAYNKGISR